MVPPNGKGVGMTNMQRAAMELDEDREPIVVPYKFERGYVSQAAYTCDHCHRPFLSVGIKQMHMQRCGERRDAKMR